MILERFPKGIVVGATLCSVLLLTYLAYFRPWYFNQSNMVGLFALELLIVALWMYRRMFFTLVIVAFLLAGMTLPGAGGGWSMVRWIVLALGAFVGLLIVLREGGVSFEFLHLLAVLAVAVFFASASVSRFPTYTLLKACSMLLLFVYASTGARIAVAGREDRFFPGLLGGCEVFVGVVAVLYFIFGINSMGNPNSLGAVMAVCAPVLLWGILLGGKTSVQGRRLILYALCMYLALGSRARAGIAAALISSALLCIALRRYKLLIKGTIALAVLLSAVSLFRPELVSSFFSSLVYKNDSGAVLASRQSPWQMTFDNINDHPWFGTGLGTTDTDGPTGQSMFSSNVSASAERGSSYLSILAGVGILGVLPTFLMLLVLLRNVMRVVSWMRHTGSPFHPAIPLALIVVAGFINAIFEDWMFAVGNYLCVFFWLSAFILADVVPSARSMTASSHTRTRAIFIPA